MRLFLFCLAALPLASVPQSALSQSAPVDSLSSFLAAGASAWDVVAEPDVAAIARREVVAQQRDNDLVGQVGAPDGEGGKSLDRAAAPAPLQVSSTVTPAPVRQRTRAVTPARSAAPGRTPRAFIAPWQTGVFQ